MSNIKTSEVTKILHNTGQFTTSNGTFYKHQITFANGDQGEYNSKSETCTKFEEGKEAQYSIEVKQNGKYTNVTIKPVEDRQFVPNKKFGGGGSIESYCLAYAKDWHCSIIESGAKTDDDAIIKTADKFYNWMKDKSTN